MKGLLYSLCGVNYKPFLKVVSDAKEIKHYQIFCFSFLCSCIFNLAGAYTLLIETTESYWLSIVGATIWTFIYYVIFRLVLVITLSDSKFSFSRLVSMLSITSLLIVLSSFSFSGMFFLLGLIMGDVEHENVYSLVEILHVIQNDISQGNARVISIAVLLPVIIVFPYLLVSTSKHIRKGKYIKFLLSEQQEIITANYKRFKKQYTEVLRDSVLVNLNSKDKFKQDELFEFYEGFENPPFNTINKKEW